MFCKKDKEYKYRFIYKSTNLINGKIYVGQHSTNNLNDGYKGSGKRFCQAVKKYGKKSFKREILEFCSSQEELNKCEIYWIDKLNPFHPIGYNIIRDVGDIFYMNEEWPDPRVNGKWSKEVILKIKATWDRKKSEGYDHGEHTRGVPKKEGFGENQRQKMLGDNNPSRKYGPPNKNIPWKKETKDKIGKVLREGKKLVGEKNPKFIDISDEQWDQIRMLIDFTPIKEISKVIGVNEQRLFRHLYYSGAILFNELPDYLKKRIIKFEIDKQEQIL